MKKFMLFVFMAVFFIIGNLGLSYGADFALPIDNLDPRLIVINTDGPNLDQLVTFEITNETGQIWTDFHLQVAFFSFTTETGLAWINGYEDDYTGSEITFSRFNASLPSDKVDVVDIVGLNIPFLPNIPNIPNTYNFQLNISSGEGWELRGNPTVGGGTPPPVSTPEPGTLLLLGSGLIGLIGYRKIMV